MISETWYLEYDPNDHKTANRIKNAKEAKYTPIDLDEVTQEAHFSGSQNRSYKTTLSDCQCRDFLVNHLPCKHMFRLAMELGYINESPKRIYNPQIEETAQDEYDPFQFLCYTFGLHEAKIQVMKSVIGLLEPNYEHLRFAFDLLLHGDSGIICKDITPYSVFSDNGLIRLERTKSNTYRVFPNGYLNNASREIRKYLQYRLKEIEIDPVVQLYLENEKQYGEFKPDYTY